MAATVTLASPTAVPSATATATSATAPTVAPTATVTATVTATATVTSRPSSPPARSGGTSWLEVLLIVVIAFAALAAGFWGGQRKRRPAGTTRRDLPRPGSLRDELAAGAAADWKQAEAGRSWLSSQDQGAGQSRGDAEAAAERARLVASCANLADKLRERQPALFSELARGLEEVGVTVESADGEPFNAERHNPIDTAPTADPAADLVVATTVRLGYRDHGTVVRSPDVIVYRMTGNGHGG